MGDEVEMGTRRRAHTAASAPRVHQAPSARHATYHFEPLEASPPELFEGCDVAVVVGVAVGDAA